MCHRRLIVIFHYPARCPKLLNALDYSSKAENIELVFSTYQDMGMRLFRFLTLPSLQEFHTNDIDFLTPACLPALVHRSSCSLTRIVIWNVSGSDLETFDGLQPLPGVTDLVLEYLDVESVVVKKLLLEEYFPDLHHLTLGLQSFLYLWHTGIISMLLDCKQPHRDTANKGRHRKILVIDQCQTGEFNDFVWKLVIGKQLKVLELNISLRGDGFEISIPEA